MTAPRIPILFPLPANGGVDKTYPELTRSMSCTCQAGALIKPSIAPIPGFNMGDIIADQAKLLSALAAGYSMLTVVMKLVACIIEVLCALVNPFAVIAAIVRLFGTCLPDFILLLPQLAIPAMILCLIKIILAIVTYIVTVIIPLIQDIIANIQNLISAISTGNQHAIKAVAFKIVSILKELFNVVGILAALDAIIAMVKALLSLGIGIPCSGGCPSCGDDQCPPVFENTSLSGADGQLSATIMYGGTQLNYLLNFSSAAHRNDFLALYDFFPTGVDYSGITDRKKLPYCLYCDGYYAVTGVNEDGILSLFPLPNPQHNDGYLSSIYRSHNGAANVDDANPGEWARFGTRSATPQFSPADGYDSVYLEIMDTDSTGAIKNSGTFPIMSAYDSYNVKVDHLVPNAWSISGAYNPTSGAGSQLVWRKIALPSTASGRPYTLFINHEELIRRSMIGVGCHPDVRAAVKGAQNRSPYLDVPIPALPDIEGAASAAMACITAIAPMDVDAQYVIDNYGSIAQAAATAGVCVTDVLGTLVGDLTTYAGDIYPRLFSPDKSLLFANCYTRTIGGDIVISIVPIDINGNRLADDLPPGVVDVQAFTTFGTLSGVTEIMDAYGVSTGEFQATLTSMKTGVAEVTATVAGQYVSDFDTTLNPPNYAARKLTLTFVDSRPADTMPQDSREPLGAAGTGGVK